MPLYNTMPADIKASLEEYFKDEPHKVQLWWVTNNPGFGGIRPCIAYGINPQKVRAWLKAQQEGHLP